jgi:hypothetical protein
MVGKPKPPSQTWKTFLTNHLKDMVSTDFFEVPPSAFAFYLYSLYSLTIVASGQGSPPPIQIFNYQ